MPDTNDAAVLTFEKLCAFPYDAPQQEATSSNAGETSAAISIGGIGEWIGERSKGKRREEGKRRDEGAEMNGSMATAECECDDWV
jgi:hypothetical protein